MPGRTDQRLCKMRLRVGLYLALVCGLLGTGAGEDAALPMAPTDVLMSLPTIPMPERPDLWDANGNYKGGTLLLNMLIKNEEVHLQRSLPAWSKIIDYWIIGVDDHNTDSSVEVIKRELKGIPGEIVYVSFDGMGATWSKLVDRGLERFPQATHGIVADADFTPMEGSLDKKQLDVRCSKHMYSIWTHGTKHERKMDWIYRNVKGAKVKRRTHQILEVPKFEGQQVYQTLVPLNIQEHEGGYQDRTGEKQQRYIRFLELDLLDFPGDERTLYYLGMAHYEFFLKKSNSPGEAENKALQEAIRYMKIRAGQTTGNYEQRYFAMLKIGEMYERWLRDFPASIEWYSAAKDVDPPRLDAYFYTGQRYRLSGDYINGLPYLMKGAKLSMPQRSLFQWHQMYTCLIHLELGRLVVSLSGANPDHLTIKVLKRARKSLKLARKGCEQSAQSEVEGLWTAIENKLVTMKTKGKGKFQQLTKVVSEFLDYATDNLQALEEYLDSRVSEAGLITDELGNHFVGLQSYLDAGQQSCRAFRISTSPYLKFFRLHMSDNKDLAKKPFFVRWNRLTDSMRTLCR